MYDLKENHFKMFIEKHAVSGLFKSIIEFQHFTITIECHIILPLLLFDAKTENRDINAYLFFISAKCYNNGYQLG